MKAGQGLPTPSLYWASSDDSKRDGNRRGLVPAIKGKQNPAPVGMGMHMVMTPILQWVYFRRQAALHEAGHIVIAKRFGLESFDYIFPTVPFDKIDSTEDKLWLGQTSSPLRKLQRLSRIRRCMIAVAGAVAEVGRGELDDILFYDPDVMSKPSTTA
jgi:hypothetical protein